MEFFILNFFSLYLVNISSDKNKFLTHDSHIKSALKYSRSSVDNQQGDIQ